MGVVPTNSALGSLTVSKAVYDKDLLLQWVSQLASPLQLKVTVDAKSAMKLEAQNVVLTSRNAILRAICGTAFHGALDHSPYFLLGGSGSSRAMMMGQLVQWMSVADSVRSCGAGDTVDSILSTLERQLGDKAFLIGSSQPCLADYDMALAVLDKDLKPYPSTQRWYNTVIWTFQHYAKESLAIPVSVSLPAVGMLTFFFGNEDMGAVLKPPAVSQPATKPAKEAAADSDNSKADQQKQGKQKGGKKQENKKAEAPAACSEDRAAAGGTQDPASFNISALDIRVGKIVKAWHHEEAEKLFCEEVDLGTETRQIASGLRYFYKTDDLQDRLVLVLCNLKKRNLVGFPSHGMVLCASNADHTQVEFVIPPEGSKPGDRVTFENYQGEPEHENKIAKKKIFEQLAPDLKTDADGNVVWKDSKAKTEAGFVKALNGMPNAQVS